MITIGQLAAYAGVTIKAVRHYHQRGLLAEPPRDSSRYRRYSAQQAIDLVKIKTLAEARVPLARINELRAADPDRVAAAVPHSRRSLQERYARGRTGGGPGPGHRPAGRDVGGPVVAGLGPAHPDRQAAQGRRVAALKCLYLVTRSLGPG